MPDKYESGKDADAREPGPLEARVARLEDRLVTARDVDELTAVVQYLVQASGQHSHMGSAGSEEEAEALAAQLPDWFNDAYHC
jgi:hypothetical protein